MKSARITLVSVSQLCEEFPAFSVASVRDLIWHATPRISAAGYRIPANGFGRCVLRVGRRVLIDRDAFVAWLESKRVVK